MPPKDDCTPLIINISKPFLSSRQLKNELIESVELARMYMSKKTCIKRIIKQDYTNIILQNFAEEYFEVMNPISMK